MFRKYYFISFLLFGFLNGVSQVPDCYTNVQYSYDSSFNPLPSGSISNVVVTWGMLPTGAVPTSFDAYVGSDWNQLNYFGSTTTNSIDISSVATSPGSWYFQLVPKNDDGANNYCSILFLDLRIPPFSPPGGYSSEECLNAIDVISIEPTISADDSWTTGQTSSDIDGAFCEEIGFVNGRSQWYKTVVPETGRLTITAREIGNTHSLNMIIEIFEGDCSFYTDVGCVLKYRLDDESITDMLNLTPNEELFIRINIFETDSSLSSKKTNRKLFSQFEISAHSQSLVLDVKDFDISGISISPNPVSDVLWLKSSEKIDKLSIYNLLGQEVMKVQGNFISKSIDVFDLQSGVYIVHVYYNNEIGYYKIIKQ